MPYNYHSTVCLRKCSICHWASSKKQFVTMIVITRAQEQETEGWRAQNKNKQKES